MSLINARIVQIDLSQLVHEFQRLNNNLEEVFHIGRKEIIPNVDFDPDDYSSVMYSNEEDELIAQHVNKKVIGR
jgi:hypothetical protein